MVRRWAQANAMKVVSCTRCWWLPIRLLLTMSRAQVALRIVARESPGLEREGVAVCGA